MYKLLWALLPLLAIACNRKQSESTMQPNAPFENTRWKITSVAGVEKLPATEKEMFARFNEGRFSAYAGCNQMTGAYTLDGSKLKITGPASTMMACPEPVMAAERAILDALAKVDRFDFDEAGDLLLIGGDAVLLRARF